MGLKPVPGAGLLLLNTVRAETEAALLTQTHVTFVATDRL